jgi:hypothetical protein
MMRVLKWKMEIIFHSKLAGGKIGGLCPNWAKAVISSTRRITSNATYTAQKIPQNIADVPERNVNMSVLYI